MSPSGIPFKEKIAHEFSGFEHLILICGHYEGIDARPLSIALFTIDSDKKPSNIFGKRVKILILIT